MEYYIQGSRERAEEIKAAFEAKGIDTTAINVGDEDFIYFSSNGLLYFEEFSNTLLKIFKTHPYYEELELPVVSKYKDGDILVTTKIRSCPFIYRKPDFNNDLAYYYVGIDGNGNLSIGWPKRTLCHFGLIADAVIAGQGQRDLLFAKIKEAGYQWNVDKKELRKIKPHYDIKNFHAGMPVLAREYDTCHWQWVLYSHFNGVGLFFAAGKTWRQCIPFEGNEHLLGTTDMPSEEFINW